MHALASQNIVQNHVDAGKHAHCGLGARMHWRASLQKQHATACSYAHACCACAQDYMAPEVLICPDKRRPEENKDKVLLAYTAQVSFMHMNCSTRAFHHSPVAGLQGRRCCVAACVCHAWRMAVSEHYLLIIAADWQSDLSHACVNCMRVSTACDSRFACVCELHDRWMHGPLAFFATSC